MLRHFKNDTRFSPGSHPTLVFPLRHANLAPVGKVVHVHLLAKDTQLFTNHSLPHGGDLRVPVD